MNKLFLAACLSALVFAHSAFAEEVTDSAMIQKAEQILYEHNYYDAAKLPDGVLDADDRTEIGYYESDHNLPVTGVLTPELYQKLLDWGVPKDIIWGGVIVYGDGSAEITSNESSREVAVGHLLENCASGCVVKTNFMNNSATGDHVVGFVSAVSCTKDGGPVYWYLKTGTSATEANDKSAAEAGLDFEPKYCALITTIGADGSTK